MGKQAAERAEQQEVLDLVSRALEHSFQSRRMSERGNRGRSGFAPAVVAAGGGGHLLDGSGNILAITVGVNQLTNA